MKKIILMLAMSGFVMASYAGTDKKSEKKACCKDKKECTKEAGKSCCKKGGEKTASAEKK